MQKFLRVLLLVFLATILISSGFLVANLLPQRNSLDDFKNQDNQTGKGNLNLTPSKNLLENPIDFVKLKEQNNEIIGWIQIEKTLVDYPILQSSPETDEDFYLNHEMDKRENKNGAIYIQKINYSDFSDRNTLIYGHNTVNGSMFGSLKKFRTKSFFEENDTIKIYTPGHILTYKIYSAFIFDDRHILATYDFTTDEGFREFIEMTLNPESKVNNVREGVEITTEDKLITLSTCTNDGKDRYLVVAVLQDDTQTK